MWNLKRLALALFLAAPLGAPTAVEAAMPRLGLEMTGTAPDVIDVAVHCGRHAHYIRGHRARNHR